MSKSESVPKMLQNALPYPIPVITPIWGANAAYLPASSAVCLPLACGIIAFDISTFELGDGKLRPPAPATTEPPYPKTFQILPLLMSTAAA